MIAVSATSRSAGLALKATPRPAVLSMSMSFAPSPTATHWASGTPKCSAAWRSAVGLPGPVDHWTDHVPGELAVVDLQLVGGDEVQPQIFGDRLHDLGETPRDGSTVEAQPLEGPYRRARPGGELQGVGHLGRAHLLAGPPAGPPGDAATAGSPAPRRIAASVTARTSTPQPARSASISITSPCTRVESTSKTTSRLARRAIPTRSTAMSTSP